MSEPTTTSPLSYAGDGGRPGGWTAVAVLALPVAVASVLFFGFMTVAAGLQLCGDGSQLYAEFSRTPPTMRALTPAEAAGVFASAPPLTPAQAATFGSRLRSRGQDWVDTTGPVPSDRDLYVWVKKQTGAAHIQSRLWSQRRNLTIATDGSVVEEERQLPPDDWPDEHRLGRAACLGADVSMAAASAVNVLAGGWLFAVAVAILGRRPTARLMAGRWAVVQLATAVAGSAAIAWACYAVVPVVDDEDPRFTLVPNTSAAALAAVLPVVVLVLLARRSREPDSVTVATAAPV